MFDKKKDLGDAAMDPQSLLHTVAEDLVDAVHARDTEGVMSALKAFLGVVQHLDAIQDTQTVNGSQA